jgi:hypothetical protein
MTTYALVTTVGVFRIDDDGDLEIEFAGDETWSCHGCKIYLGRGEREQLMRWLVTMAETDSPQRR